MDMNLKYNRRQVEMLSEFGKQNGVVAFKLHAYNNQLKMKRQGGPLDHLPFAFAQIVEEPNYTKAAKADVDWMEVSPTSLKEGVENLISKHPDCDVTISSKVNMGIGVHPKHMLMLDLIIPFKKGETLPNPVARLMADVQNYTQLDAASEPTYLASGQSIHVYGKEDLLEVSEFRKLTGALLVCDREQVLDHQWLGFAIEREEFRLRLTKVQDKYLSVPEFILF